MTLADRITLARLVLAPLAVAGYLWLPVGGSLCFWVCGLLCGIAEFTDWLDGKVARARGEVSDFGKLADPFCDVLYRCAVFLAYLLPAGGVGYVVVASGQGGPGVDGAQHISVDALWGQSVYVVGWQDGAPVLGAGLIPWLPVFLMVLRELVAGALRAMAATKGLVLAARNSGKVKAWFQGVALITIMAFPALWFQRAEWHLAWAAGITWACAGLSVYSIIEYLWVNRAVLAQLAERRPAPTAADKKAL
jgi:CDP-diacylglycerol--glycerol-3-phosphate 3-phosphatidyltransferase